MVPPDPVHDERPSLARQALAVGALVAVALVLVVAVGQRIPVAVSPPVTAGGLTAQVFRQEIPQELGDEPYGCDWLLHVSDSAGHVRQGRIGGSDWFSADAMRAVRYRVEWQEPGWSLRLSGSADQTATAYLFRDGVRAVSLPSDLVRQVNGSEAVPMDEALRERLGRLPYPAEALARLRVVRLEGDEGSQVVDVVCEDPDVLLVLERGFQSSGQVVSRGPVLVTRSSGEVASASWVFFDSATPGGFDPVLAEQVFTVQGAHAHPEAFVRPPTELPARK